MIAGNDKREFIIPEGFIDLTFYFLKDVIQVTDMAGEPVVFQGIIRLLFKVLEKDIGVVHLIDVIVEILNADHFFSLVIDENFSSIQFSGFGRLGRNESMGS